MTDHLAVVEVADTAVHKAAEQARRKAAAGVAVARIVVAVADTSAGRSWDGSFEEAKRAAQGGADEHAVPVPVLGRAIVAAGLGVGDNQSGAEQEGIGLDAENRTVEADAEEVVGNSRRAWVRCSRVCQLLESCVLLFHLYQRVHHDRPLHHSDMGDTVGIQWQAEQEEGRAAEARNCKPCSRTQGLIVVLFLTLASALVVMVSRFEVGCFVG